MGNHKLPIGKFCICLRQRRIYHQYYTLSFGVHCCHINLWNTLTLTLILLLTLNPKPHSMILTLILVTTRSVTPSDIGLPPNECDWVVRFRTLPEHQSTSYFYGCRMNKHREYFWVLYTSPTSPYKRKVLIERLWISSNPISFKKVTDKLMIACNNTPGTLICHLFLTICTTSQFAKDSTVHITRKQSCLNTK